MFDFFAKVVGALFGDDNDTGNESGPNYDHGVEGDYDGEYWDSLDDSSD